MIDRSHDLSLTRQAKLMRISRGSCYYRRKHPSERTTQLMHSLDALHAAHPFAGSRMLRGLLQRQGHCVGRRHVRTLMQRMCITALYCKPRTSARHPQHKIYPYLLRRKTVTHANQVWAIDITYVRMHKGWLYLCAVVDWFSRKVLSWKLSNTMDVEFCVDAVREAITRWGTPAIFNTDQGSQFTSDAFTAELKRHAIRISMDGKGAWRDNVFVERLWRAPSSTKKSISKPMTACVPHAVQLPNTWSSTIQSGPIRPTTNRRRMRRTLQHCRLHKCRRHNPADLA
jgi:putative transposase